jgi:peptidoglycan/LPS O-acetylase OafA/YrhL
MEFQSRVIVQRLRTSCCSSVENRVTRKNLRTLGWVLLVLATAPAVAGGPSASRPGNDFRGRLATHGRALDVRRLLLSFLVVGSGSHRTYVSNRVLQFFGYIRYRFYLVHIRMFRFCDWLSKHYFSAQVARDWRFDRVALRFVALGTATLVSYLSRRYYEDRFLRLKQRLAPEESRSPGKNRRNDGSMAGVG